MLSGVGLWRPARSGTGGASILGSFGSSLLHEDLTGEPLESDLAGFFVDDENALLLISWFFMPTESTKGNGLKKVYFFP